MADERRGSRSWAILAVALALMALVTALSSTSGHSRPVALQRRTQRTVPAKRTMSDTAQRAGRRSHAGLGSPRLRALSTLAAPAPKASRAADAGTGTSAGSAGPHRATGAAFSQPDPGASGTPGTGFLEAADSWSPATGPSLLPAASGSASSSPSGSASGAASGAARSNGGGTATSPPTGAYPGHGSIEPPATSATFAALGGGTVSARATWTDTPDLELEISCGDGVSATRTGSSELSLEVDDTHGTGSCTVTLSLPPGVRADVPFTLVVDPAP
ncbi:MAG: hypothetical protein M0Z40_12150 [Actinomycetota bacterium]|nr:hypothetical protein [Actinomycetota bacterium]